MSPKTNGIVFNRKDPRKPADLYRKLEPSKNVFKYSIPNNSVVNNVGKCKFCCCFGWRLTAAQWIWAMNLICFVAHTTMVFVTSYMAWWKKDLQIYGDENPYAIKIYRVTAKWNNNTQDGYEFALEENGFPIDIALSTLAFFLISACFHLFAIVVGLFETTWFWYWKQIDDAFCYWRWIEYSISASLMGMTLAITVGIREQNTLALIFMAFWSTMMLGMMTEIYSRPVVHADSSDYKTKFGNLGFINQIKPSLWEGSHIIRDRDGFFPFTAAMVVIVYHLEYAKHKLHTETELEMPFFVDAIIYGSLLLFSSFTFVQMIYQWLPPNLYFGSEICYCALSLAAKLWLGVFMLFNVIGVEMRAEDALGSAALEPRR